MRQLCATKKIQKNSHPFGGLGTNGSNVAASVDSSHLLLHLNPALSSVVRMSGSLEGIYGRLRGWSFEVSLMILVLSSAKRHVQHIISPLMSKSHTARVCVHLRVYCECSCGVTGSVVSADTAHRYV